ncbi:Gfo/Idh/MocA family oxidoreductase [Rathayibacter sp. VKM Ac-2835]|uniref:Gfo/Idh/MocA family oxidoreductase n=1 Tax=Rathayibacter sp. VKM Ac-2835 TaxID=2739043 RepID=UPI0015636E1D|nr:Gfo/Idh/MocA family oxidoreductase [Rathayibacter sp. VKM Ac-2835]NRG43037.1 Gfo/Idh/MocA family oxidoreductase [Rathayibacter sp. VKM Ac-2835]
MMAPTTHDSAKRRTRYALIGSGHRAEMYLRAIATEHSDVAELVAIGDSNADRAGLSAQWFSEWSKTQLPPTLFAPGELETIIRDLAIDRVIVTTPDVWHAEYIDRSLRAGADVVVEKPLTIDAAGCARIIAAQQDTGRSVTMTFNYRYSPRNSALKALVQSGAIGRVTSVDFEWVLDTSHGADYFRRWHRDKANSGGLLIHKASHHFDLVNWWIDDSPEKVYAAGGLRFYGGADQEVTARYTPDETSPFHLDLAADPRLDALYGEPRRLDGYRRDLGVFEPGVTIEDNLALTVTYESGVPLSYSLNAHAPWEGYRVVVNGTEGRAELNVVERSAVVLDANGGTVIDPSANPQEDLDDPNRPVGESLLLQRHWQRAENVEIPSGIGGHGGGDAILLSDVFNGPSPDPLGRPSDATDGLRAVAVGILGNRSLVTGLPASIDELELGIDLSKRIPAGSAL